MSACPWYAANVTHLVTQADEHTRLFRRTFRDLQHVRLSRPRTQPFPLLPPPSHQLSALYALSVPL